MARALSHQLHHREAAAATRSASLAANAEEADYGLVRGTFSALALLRRPMLHVYAEYLRGCGVEAPAEPGAVEAVVEVRVAAAGAAGDAAAAVSAASEAEAANASGGR